MIWFGILLIILPILNFIIQYYYTRTTKTLDLFKNHWIAYWGDFIFIPINILFFAMNTVSSLTIGWLFLASIVFNSIIHRWRWWANKKWIISHMFYSTSSKLNPAWITHFIYSVIETTVLMAIIFSHYNANTFPLLFGSIIVFSAVLLVGSYHLHKKIVIRDVLVFVALSLALIIKMIVWNT